MHENYLETSMHLVFNAWHLKNWVFDHSEILKQERNDEKIRFFKKNRNTA